MRGQGPAALPEGHRILPDGRMEFVFQLADPFFERGENGRWRLQDPFLLVGQMERRVDIRPKGVIRTVGIHFRPAGVAAFVSGDLRRFANRIVSLSAALRADLDPLIARLRSARTRQGEKALLEDFLRDRKGAGDPAMARAATRLVAPEGVVDLEAVATEFGLGGRQFRRRFEGAVGIGPKRFARLIRFQRVFEQRLERDARAWSSVALECGYYDQAHFNRDFKAFTGVRPRDLLRDADPLTAFFLTVSSKTASRGSR